MERAPGSTAPIWGERPINCYMRPHFAGYPRVRVRVVEECDVALLDDSADAAKVSSRGPRFAEAAHRPRVGGRQRGATRFVVTRNKGPAISALASRVGQRSGVPRATGRTVLPPWELRAA